MDIKEQIEELVENYNKCLESKQKMHDMSQQYLGQIQLLNKMQEENARQERLRTARETCLPCQGTWPNCMCGGNIQTGNQAIKKLQVTREKDEADGVDQTLPRNDTVQSNMNYGKPSIKDELKLLRQQIRNLCQQLKLIKKRYMVFNSIQR